MGFLLLRGWGCPVGCLRSDFDTDVKPVPTADHSGGDASGLSKTDQHFLRFILESSNTLH